MLDYRTIIIKRYALNLSDREIAKQIGASKSGVNEFLKSFEECNAISYPLPNGITNYGIAELVYGNPPGNKGRNPNIKCIGISASKQADILTSIVSSANITPNGAKKMRRPYISMLSSARRWK